MANTVNLIGLQPGDIVRMGDGTLVKVLQNPGDGLWIFGAQIEDAQQAQEDLPEEPIFAQDIEELVSRA